jgi:hypothetical protein
MNFKFYKKNFLVISLIIKSIIFPGNVLAFSDLEIENELIRQAKISSKNLPLETKTTSLVNIVGGPGRRMTFWIIMKGTSASNITAEWKSQRTRILTNIYCTNPEFKTFWEDNILASWTDIDPNGVTILTTNVTPVDCHKK